MSLVVFKSNQLFRQWQDEENFSFKFIETPMTIQWTILDPLTDDTAVYECSVDYTEAGQKQTIAGQQYLAADGKIRNISVSLNYMTQPYKVMKLCLVHRVIKLHVAVTTLCKVCTF